MRLRRRNRSARRTDPSRLRLWPIGWALAVCFAAAALGLGGLSWLVWKLLHHPKLPHSSAISLHDTIGVLQLVFASVAGAGALVALVVAYRRQKVAETVTAHDRTRVLNERFTTIAGQLGDDKAAVRLAGVHAMAGLADDWEENRQTCIDVLCAYLRMPYEPEPRDEASAAERLAFRGNREVRHTLIRAGAEFSGGTVTFDSARFSGDPLLVAFIRAQFSGGTVSFDSARFSNELGFVVFDEAEFSGGTVSFDNAKFSGGTVRFDNAKFSGGTVDFSGVADWSHPPTFDWEGTPPTGVKLPAAFVGDSPQ